MTQETSTFPIIRRLLEERGVRRYTLFLLQQEGTILSGNIEAISGFALDESGAVHGFWLGYDEAGQDFTFDRFYRVDEPESQFGSDMEFKRAQLRLKPKSRVKRD
jgi:hypothetical protein